MENLIRQFDVLLSEMDYRQIIKLRALEGFLIHNSNTDNNKYSDMFIADELPVNNFGLHLFCLSSAYEVVKLIIQEKKFTPGLKADLNHYMKMLTDDALKNMCNNNYKDNKVMENIYTSFQSADKFDMTTQEYIEYEQMALHILADELKTVRLFQNIIPGPMNLDSKFSIVRGCHNKIRLVAISMLGFLKERGFLSDIDFTIKTTDKEIVIDVDYTTRDIFSEPTEALII